SESSLVRCATASLSRSSVFTQVTSTVFRSGRLMPALPCAGMGRGSIFRSGGLLMTIKVGDKLPSVTSRYLGPDGVQAVTTDDFFRGKKVALFAVPGAYTRTCSQRHLPGYVSHAAEIKAKGVDTIACIAVNDHFVMNAWGKEHDA